MHALLASLCTFTHPFERVSNRSLRELVACLLPGYTARQITSDLRRLRRNGFLVRVDRSNRYRLTADGRRLAVFFAKTYARLVTPSHRRARSRAPRRDRRPLSTGALLAQLRTGPHRPHRRRRARRLTK